MAAEACLDGSICENVLSSKLSSKIYWQRKYYFCGS
jgi:hypothetical protein